MYDPFIKIKFTLGQEILGKDFLWAKCFLKSHCIDIIIYDSKEVKKKSKRMAVVVRLDEFNKIIEVVEWI